MSNGLSPEEERALYKGASPAVPPIPWRKEALDLGVDPEQWDDFTFSVYLQRARDTLDLFKHHAPTDDQIGRISNVREGAIAFAKVIMRNVNQASMHPWGAEDYAAAIRLVHEAMMTANKSIVNEKVKA